MPREHGLLRVTHQDRGICCSTANHGVRPRYRCTMQDVRRESGWDFPRKMEVVAECWRGPGERSWPTEVSRATRGAASTLDSRAIHHNSN